MNKLKTIKKSTASVILTVLLLGVMFYAQCAYAANNDIASGTFDGVDWRITSDGRLEIGTINGDQSFSYSETDREIPWLGYSTQIKEAVFLNTVSGNGSVANFFKGCSSLQSLSLDSFDMSKVTDTSGFLSGCTKLSIVEAPRKIGEGTTISLPFAMYDYDGKQYTTISIGNKGKTLYPHPSITITATNQSKTYDGKPLTADSSASLTTGTLPDGYSIKATCSGSQTMAGTSTKKLETVKIFNKNGTDITSDYIITKANGTLRVNLRTLEITTGSATKVYDGKPLTCKDITVKGTLETEPIKVYTTGSITEVGSTKNTYTIDWGNVNPDNYGCDKNNTSTYKEAIIEKLGTLTVTKDPYSAVHESFSIKNEEYKGKYRFYYKDSYFGDTATKYNHSLATMSLCLAFSAYPRVEKDGSSPYSNYDKNVKDVMYKCGFTGDNYDKYSQYSFNERPTKSSIGCAIGSKKLADNTTLIAVAVRSSGYEQEWASNFDVGTSGDHMGFSQSATLVREDIGNYISSHGISGKIKIWITGFSRGAAVATQTAAKLNNGSFPNVTYSKNDVYAYGFATPAGAAMESDPNSNKYNNIFSLVHYHDIVPLVAPELWGFNRYGTTYVFPYSATELGSAKYEKEMKSYFEKMKKALGKSPSSYAIDSNWIIAKGQHVELGINGIISIGTLNRRIVDTIARNMGIRVTSIFTLNPRQNYRTVYQDIFTESAEKANADRKCNKDDASILIKSIGCLEPSNFKAFESANLIAKTIRFNPLLIAFTVENVSDLAMAHAEPEYYLSWMQVMDKNYGSSLTPTFKKGFGRYIKVNCPVDVHVYDSNGQLVASIVNEEVQEIDTSVLEAFIDENGQKTVMLPIDEQYRVEVTARENCDVGYTVEEVAGISDEPVRIVNYDAGNVNKGDTLLATADSISENEETLQNGSSVDYEAFNGEEKLNPVNDICGEEEIRNHQYTIQVEYDENCGTAYGTGVYTEGSYVQLRAENREGFDFEGFYINGNKLEDSDEDNDPKTVRLKVTGNLFIKAEFVEHVHQFSSWKVIKKATEVSAGQKTRTCSKCGFTEKSTIAMLKPTLPAVTIKTPKAAKKAATVKWKKISKAKQKKVGYIQIQYSTDKKFKSGTKTVTAKKSSASKKIKSLKSKKTYYFRIRAYKQSGGVVHVSKWSKVKAVKVK